MADCKDYGFMTRALHAGWDCDPATGALGLPIYATAAYQFHDGAHAERLFNLEEEGFTYSRIANPTVKAFEDTLASLESGVGAVALASGQAALSHIAAALCEAAGSSGRGEVSEAKTGRAAAAKTAAARAAAAARRGKVTGFMMQRPPWGVWIR